MRNLVKKHALQNTCSPAFTCRATSPTANPAIPLNNQEDNLQILEHLPVFIYLLTKDYTLSYVNHAFRKEFGIPDQFTRCYSILRKSNEPCNPCPAMDVFSDNKERVWQWQDTLRGNMYQVHDIPYGNIEETARVLGVGINLTRIAHTEKKREQYFSANDFLRICCYCNKIHNKSGEWQRVEAYFSEEQNIRFSHSICPQCMHTHYPDIM
ncbi:hypothetical protein SAMN02745220_00297 [Desulfopila aestuarii DSM 18488]|uniref:PAS fold-containing protein n=1 Tax=Desulfopila aestuarii DSM 18488 TaxID=1121416 RepID=A0A1M7XWJ2_9BACT|nr:hypothetical protein SAMN02745220_00297 [Desulfopila aestuarii DSM 18488]